MGESRLATARTPKDPDEDSHGLKQLGDEIAGLFVRRARKFKNASLFAKIALISIGSAISAIAQFTEFGEDGPTGWQAAGIGASIVVAVGGIFVWLTEEDGPEELSTAHKAVERAREALTGYEAFYEVADENDRLVYLIQAIYLMRNVLEAASVSHLDEDALGRTLLQACDRSLPISMNFQQSDQWTIGVYKAVPTQGDRRELRCIATKRAFEADPKSARSWKEGTGIAGVSFSIQEEVIIPDLQAEGISSVFGAAGNERRKYDAERYRSMIAVPIMVDGDNVPWGIVSATNDRVNHFSAEQANGLSTLEGARALAGMMALGVAITRNHIGETPATEASNERDSLQNGK